MAKHLAQHKRPFLIPVLTQGLTKNKIAELVARSVSQLLEDGNVFEVAETLAAMEEFAKTFRKSENYISFLRDELAKYNGTLFTATGAKIELCEAGVTYNYSDNAEWQLLTQQIQSLQEQKKALEAQLRAIGDGRMTVDTETGEVLEGARRSSKSTYKITLAR